VDRGEIAEAPDLPRCQELEAKAANIYFAIWGSRVEPRWAARDIDRIPAHWRTFSTRSTPLLAGKTPRNAADPINAMLNYGYTIAAVEARVAALTLGLDPGLGILHTDKRDRDSFALDLVETIRPHVDATVLQLISGRHFRRGDFHETRDGRVRLLAPLTHELAEYAPAWAAAIAPHAESAAHTIIDNAIGQIRRPTPLTRTNVRAAQALTDARRSERRADQKKPVSPTCRTCGAPLPSARRQLCVNCWPAHRRQLATARAAKGREVAATSHQTDHRARAVWETSGALPAISAQVFTDAVLPALEALPLSALASATGLSISACSRIRSGKLSPHPRHWDALAFLVQRAL
jgi:hypothetical protein